MPTTDEPVTAAPVSVAAPAIYVLEPIEPGGPWGYRCDLCPSTWRNFTDGEAAAWYALLHGRTVHRAR